MKKASMKQTRLFLIVLIVFLLAVAAVAVKIRHQPFPSVESEFQKIVKTYGGKTEEKADMSIWWVSTDGLNIVNDNSSAVELFTFVCENDTESRLVFHKIAESLSPAVDEIMNQYGFSPNEENSSASIDDVRLYDYVKAYEKGNTKCVFLANPDCSAYTPSEQVHYTFSLGCTDAFNKNYQTQAPYLKDLDITDAVIHVVKKAGDFIMLNVNYRRSGHYTIAKLMDGKWTELFSGQDIPPCDIVEKYQIPKDIVSDCYQNGSQ